MKGRNKKNDNNNETSKGGSGRRHSIKTVHIDVRIYILHITYIMYWYIVRVYT